MGDKRILSGADGIFVAVPYHWLEYTLVMRCDTLKCILLDRIFFPKRHVNLIISKEKLEKENNFLPLAMLRIFDTRLSNEQIKRFIQQQFFFRL